MIAGSRSRRGVVIGLAAAASFGAAAPVAKRLLEDVEPQLLAGLLYLGAFLALAVVLPSRRRSREARLQRRDLPKLAGVVVSGGIVAPVLLLVGLERVSGATGSLLLNLEGPFTLVIGLAMFGEHLGRRALLGAAAVFGAGALLSLGGPDGSADAIGVVCIAAACGFWGADNNLTQALTLRDPFRIVAVKAGVAATVNTAIAIARGDELPAAAIVTGALALGAVSYGASIVLDAYALRLLGAAREAVVFATAPFVGVAIALPMLSETLSVVEVTAGLVMVVGVALILRERHEHRHLHEELAHEHVHVHDEHHGHVHDADAPPGEPHSHEHRHEPLVHTHPHVSDVHHRHSH